MNKLYRRKTSLLTLIVIILMAGLLTGCSGKSKPASEGLRQTGANKTVFRVGVVLVPPGPGDKGLNDAVIAGVRKAEEQLGIEYKVLRPGDLVNDIESLSYFAENNYDLVIAAGPTLQKELHKVAQRFKDIRFVVVDNQVNQPNVTSILFNEEHGGFLAGVAAAAASKTGLVGFIGGAQSDDEARRYQAGFLKGVQYYNNSDNKKLRVFISYAGVFADSMEKPELGSELANLQYGSGADIIFQAAGKTGNGVYLAGQQANRFVMGYNKRQAEAAPGNNMGTIDKKIDNVIFETVKRAMANELEAGTQFYGLDSGSLDFLAGPATPEEIKGRMNNTKDLLIKGNLHLDQIKLAEGLEIKLERGADAPTPPPTKAPGASTGSGAGTGNTGSSRPQNPTGSTGNTGGGPGNAPQPDTGNQQPAPDPSEGGGSSPIPNEPPSGEVGNGQPPPGNSPPPSNGQIPGSDQPL